MSEVDELRSKTEEELTSIVSDLDVEIFKLRNELKVTRKLEKPHVLSQKKRKRAKVLTILTEKGKVTK